MGWDEIDFEKIVIGATTVDVNSEQNFYNVLDQFAFALDERLNVITSSQDILPELPSIFFNIEGEIRAGTTFMDKYRDLLEGYFNIWNDFDWYAPAVLEDPLNAEDYLLEDIDLEVAMGINAYDLLINREDKNRVELWSADLLNGLYELYKLTQVTLKTLARRATTTTTLYNHPMFWTGDDNVRLSRTGGSNDDDTTYAAQKAAAIADRVITTHPSGTFFVPKMCFYSQAVIGSAVGGGGVDHDLWGVGQVSTDSFVVTMKVLDLFGVDINMDIVGTGMEVLENYTETSTPSAPNPVYATPEAGLPFVGPNDAVITVPLAANSVTLDATLGYRNNFFLYGTPDAQVFPPFIEPSTTTSDIDFDVQFDIAMHNEFLIDVNNSALIFFIEEEEEE